MTANLTSPMNPKHVNDTVRGIDALRANPESGTASEDELLEGISSFRSARPGL
ncbi:hypothetical protein LZ198_42320 [Myxococcus sp. K15C18031901]|uniref:hypothetical protein n=1 Tax=Myxococcus dinghuensis TaxID=2906761 RepID=UPI0020A70662|nr:hypothetical protein [Myxococcus dinghuensis]MCP3105508.1 hypothetical protein [Myxococcus dinghuensis]